FGGESTVFVRDRITEFMVKRFLDHIEVSVFTENRRNKEPMVCRAYTTVSADIAVECASGESGCVRCFPMVVVRTKDIRIGSMFRIVSRHQSSFRNSVLRLSDQHTVHDDFVSGLHIFHEKFMLGRNVILQDIYLSIVQQL